jgi:hypothetical protein
MQGFTNTLLADYAGIIRTSFYRMENGDHAVAVGAIYAVFMQLGMEKDLGLIAFQKGLTKEFINMIKHKNYRSKHQRSKNKSSLVKTPIKIIKKP